MREACLCQGSPHLMYRTFNTALSDLMLGRTHFVELTVERKKRQMWGRCFHAKDAVDNIKVSFGEKSQCTDELSLIMVRDPFVAQDIDQALRCLVPGHLVYFGEDVDALRNHALEDDSPHAPRFELVKEILCFAEKGFVVSHEISDEHICIR